MATASIRGLRSRQSRYSSPTQNVEKEPEAKEPEVPAANGVQRTFLETWVEPPLRPPAPSFEDTKGLERVGVLEHMTPLGQMPSQKLIQKLKLGSHRIVFRATPGGQTEEVVTPSTEVERVDFPSPIDVQMRSVSVQPEEATPMSSPDRRSLSKQVDGTMSPRVESTPPPMKASFPPSNSASPMTASSPRKWAADRMHFKIEAAAQRAEETGSMNLVPGLRMLHKDALTNPELWTVLEAVLNQTTTHPQLRIFTKYIKDGVKRYSNTTPSDNFQMYQGPPYPFSSEQMRDRSASSTFQTNNSTPAPSNNQTPPIMSPIRLKPSPAIVQHRPSPTKTPHSSSKTRAGSAMDSEIGQASEAQARLHSSPRRRRSRSASTSSSLSSAKSIPESFAPVLEADVEAQVNGTRPVRSSGQRQGANRVAAGNRSRSSATISTHAKHPFSDFSTTSKFSAKRVKRTREEIELDYAEIEKRRRDLTEHSFVDYNEISRPEINDRTVLEPDHSHPTSLPVRVPPPVVHAHPLIPSRAALSSPVSLQALPEHSLQNGTSRKRPYNEVDQDDTDIPTPLSSSPGPLLVPPPPPGAVGFIRAGTPRAAKLPPPGKARKSARVMVSPNKPKNGGITAGISRAGPGRDSVIGNGADSGAEDNDEFCASCGGEGILLCCDGCTNSFHHTCLEPPLDPDDEVEGEWFCPRCIARRNTGRIETSGLFGRIIRRVDDIIPKAFTLPYEIRDYFEGVKTGDEGEYEEVGLPRTQNNAVKMNRAGFFDEPNYKELRDSKGNFISCYRCGLTSGGRDIIPCDYCPARWHLDCLDPPLAVPPRRRIGDKPNASWRCPLHIEHDLANISRAETAAPGDLGRMPRLRRPKNATPIDVAVSRGFRNNGIIDVELMKDELLDIKEVEMNGQVYRLPEKGIRLDFIDRVKRSWYEDQTFPGLIRRRKHFRETPYRPDLPPSHMVRRRAPVGVGAVSLAEALSIQATAEANAALRRKSFMEQQAVLSLVGMVDDGDAISGDRLADLTNQLIMDAPAQVGELMQQDEIQTLEKLMELANARLAALGRGDDATERQGKENRGLVNGVGGKSDAAEAENGSDASGSGSEMDITD